MSDFIIFEGQCYLCIVLAGSIMMTYFFFFHFPLRWCFVFFQNHIQSVQLRRVWTRYTLLLIKSPCQIICSTLSQSCQERFYGFVKGKGYSLQLLVTNHKVHIYDVSYICLKGVNRFLTYLTITKAKIYTHQQNYLPRNIRNIIIM